MRKRLFGGAVSSIIRGLILLAISLSSWLGDYRTIDQTGYVYMAIFTLLAVGLLVWAGKIIRENHRTYRQFFDRFPELNGQLAAVEAGATFIDKTFGLVIYKKHLIAYRTGQFAYVPLEQVSTLTYEKVSGSLKRLPKIHLIADMDGESRPVYLSVNALTLNNPKLWLEDLYRAIEKEFPQITYH